MSRTPKRAPALRNVFFFSDADLKANRNGKLTQHQRTLLGRHRWDQVPVYAAIVGICLLVYVAIVVDSIQRQGENSVGGVMVLTLICGGFVVLLVRNLIQKNRLMRL